MNKVERLIVEAERELEGNQAELARWKPLMRDTSALDAIFAQRQIYKEEKPFNVNNTAVWQ